MLGSLHCVGMCGGIVGFACGSSQRPALTHATYHAGRLLAYLCLGAAAGWAGSSMDGAGELLGLQHAAALLSGATMVGWGVWTLLKVKLEPKQFVALRVKPSSPGQRGMVSRAYARLYQLPGPTRALLLGASSGLLPCGWLYAFVASAAGQADIARGSLLMAAFWAGSLPALVGAGSVVQLVGSRLRRHLPLVTALVLVTLGLGNIVARSNVAPPWVHDGVSPSSTPSHDCHAH